MCFWLSNVLTTLNFLIAVYTFFKNDDVAHLAIASIFSFVLGPVFAVFRWRFRQGIRFVPAILFIGQAVYITLGAAGVSRRMIMGLE